MPHIFKVLITCPGINLKKWAPPQAAAGMAQLLPCIDQVIDWVIDKDYGGAGGEMGWVEWRDEE